MSKKIVKKKEPMKEGEMRFRQVKIEFPTSTLDAKGDDIMYGMPLLVLENIKKHIEEAIAHIKSKK